MVIRSEMSVNKEKSMLDIFSGTSKDTLRIYEINLSSASEWRDESKCIYVSIGSDK